MTEWQPLSWINFHILALHYNEEYKDKYINFFNTFKVIIPCKICRDHYNKNINKDNFNIENNINNNNIFNWTVDLHNSVNKINKKKQWSYEEAANYYNNNDFNIKRFISFLNSFIIRNYKKGFDKTNNLIDMIKSSIYLIPNKDKRNSLIDFENNYKVQKCEYK